VGFHGGGGRRGKGKGGRDQIAACIARIDPPPIYSNRYGLDGGAPISFAGRGSMRGRFGLKNAPNPQIGPGGAIRVGMTYLLELLLKSFGSGGNSQIF
jgi:hypothetical protein